MNIKLPLATPLILCTVAGLLTGCAHNTPTEPNRSAHSSDANAQSQRNAEFVLRQRSQILQQRRQHH